MLQIYVLISHIDSLSLCVVKAEVAFISQVADSYLNVTIYTALLTVTSTTARRLTSCEDATIDVMRAAVRSHKITLQGSNWET